MKQFLVIALALLCAGAMAMEAQVVKISSGSRDTLQLDSLCISYGYNNSYAARQHCEKVNQALNLISNQRVHLNTSGCYYAGYCGGLSNAYRLDTTAYTYE